MAAFGRGDGNRQVRVGQLRLSAFGCFKRSHRRGRDDLRRPIQEGANTRRKLTILRIERDQRRRRRGEIRKDLDQSPLGEVVAKRPTTMVLIEPVPDGGYGRADDVFVMPEAYRATD